MAQSYLLTGHPRVGKTTAIKKIIDGLGRKSCGGFYTEELRAADERYGFQKETMDGISGRLADVAYTHASHRVGKYGVDLTFLEKFAIPSLSHAVMFSLFIVIDKIGPMQLCSPLFKPAVERVLKSPVPLIATIQAEPDPWVDEIKRRHNVILYTLTEENRDDVPGIVIRLLKGETRLACLFDGWW